MNKQEIKSRIKELELQLKKAKEELKAFPKQVGDVLEDGSVVLIKSEQHIVVMKHPKDDVLGYYKEVKSDEVLCEMYANGWFVPDHNLLRYSMRNFSNYFFITESYWCLPDTVKEGYGLCLKLNTTGEVNTNYHKSDICHYIKLFKFIHNDVL